MTTRVAPHELDRAAGTLRAGGLVALPTETVYGLGADALNVDAVARIFEAKGRPHFDPLIVHVADRDTARRCAADWPRAAAQLADAFWPGPLTLVVRKHVADEAASAQDAAHETAGGHAPRLCIPDLVTAGLPTVAVRVPGHELARRLIAQAGVPVAAPSANRFGGVSPTRPEHVEAELAGRIDAVVDGGPCDTGVESTVVSMLTDPPTVLRLGGLAVEAIERVIGPVQMPRGKADRDESADHESEDQAQLGRQSPGMLSRHYAPGTRLTLVDRVEAMDWSALSESASPQRIGVLLFMDRPAWRDAPPSPVAQVQTLSRTGDLHEAAANLFAALRRLDEAALDMIVAERAPEQGIGRAINDRLQRAADD